jgi:TPP-dependent pyruvate/acetoin dehydrogenase alpha subunit
MVAMRMFEELVQSHAIRGSTHLAIGQAAVAGGLRRATTGGDIVAPTHRGLLRRCCGDPAFYTRPLL